MQHGTCCEIQRARQDTVPRSLIGVGAWRHRYRGQIRLGRSLANPCIPTDCLVDQFPLERAAERFFAEFFSFLFDNISAYYLVFASFFPTLLYSILLLCCFVYGLEQCVCLSARINTIPHLVLSQCKIYRAVTFNWGSKQLLCFQHIFELSIMFLQPFLFFFWPH